MARIAATTSAGTMILRNHRRERPCGSSTATTPIGAAIVTSVARHRDRVFAGYHGQHGDAIDRTDDRARVVDDVDGKVGRGDEANGVANLRLDTHRSVARALGRRLHDRADGDDMAA